MKAIEGHEIEMLPLVDETLALWCACGFEKNLGDRTSPEEAMAAAEEHWRSVQERPKITTEELVLRCRCGEFTRFLKHTGAVYRSTVGCCGHERFTRWIYDHSLSCATEGGQWLTVEPMPIGGET